MATLRPRNNIIIIEKEEDQNVTSGGIVRARVDKKQASIGRVLAVGPGSYDEEGVFRVCGVSVGDRIAYDINFQKTFRLGLDYVICLKAEGIFGILPA